MSMICVGDKAAQFICFQADGLVAGDREA